MKDFRRLQSLPVVCFWFSGCCSLKPLPHCFNVAFYLTLDERKPQNKDSNNRRQQHPAFVFHVSHICLLFHSVPLAGERKPFNSPPRSPFHLLTFVFVIEKEVLCFIERSCRCVLRQHQCLNFTRDTIFGKKWNKSKKLLVEQRGRRQTGLMDQLERGRELETVEEVQSGEPF